MKSKAGHYIVRVIILIIAIGFIVLLLLPSSFIGELSGWVKGFLALCILAFAVVEMFGYFDDSGLLGKILRRKD